MLDSLSNLSNSDGEDGERTWQIPKTRKMKDKKAKKMVVATRASTRIARDGCTIAEKDAARAVAKNTLIGTTSKPSNPFTVLNNVETSSLDHVLGESQIGVFKAEELARAAVAEANYKVFLDKMKDRDKPPTDEFSSDLSMGVIDNSVRLNSGNDIMGEGDPGMDTNIRSMVTGPPGGEVIILLVVVWRK